MSITLLASQVPPVQIAATLPTLAQAYTSASGTATGAKNFGQGTLNYPDLNDHAQRIDYASVFGGGRIRAILDGLVLTVSGGNYSVSAGHALIDSLVEYAGTPSPQALPSGSGTKYFWLQKIPSGSSSVVNVTILSSRTAVPGDSTTGAIGVYIGAVLSSGAVDTSGVVYDAGDGGRVRSTADNNVPSDTPPNGIRIRTFTQGGEYSWDGFFTHQWQIAGTAGTAIYFGNMPHSSTDATTHDNSPANGKHVMPTDRTGWDTAKTQAQSATDKFASGKNVDITRPDGSIEHFTDGLLMSVTPAP